jgi:hypothetical protein
MEVNGQLHAPASIPQRKEPRYPLDRRLGGPQGRSGRCGEENILLTLSAIEPRPSSPSLYRLNYPVSRTGTETAVRCRNAAVITQNMNRVILFHRFELEWKLSAIVDLLHRIKFRCHSCLQTVPAGGRLEIIKRPRLLLCFKIMALIMFN